MDGIALRRSRRSQDDSLVELFSRDMPPGVAAVKDWLYRRISEASRAGHWSITVYPDEFPWSLSRTEIAMLLTHFSRQGYRVTPNEGRGLPADLGGLILNVNVAWDTMDG